MSSEVFFSPVITPNEVLKLYQASGCTLTGKVAVKLHSGEPGNQNFLGPEFWEPIIRNVNGTVVECNTAYPGNRNTTEKHLETLNNHGWSKYFDVDLLDRDGPDAVLAIPEGKRIQKVPVGKNLLNYDSMLVLSHFKGHPMGGYGGALKQISIGCASSFGKAYIHGVGVPEMIWTADHNSFLESMADAASAVYKLFDGNIFFVNVLKNLSVDCDCCAVAEDPCMRDIGIMASYDPVALDKACIDIVFNSDDPGKDHFIERVISKNGVHTIDAAESLGFGTTDYSLITV